MVNILFYESCGTIVPFEIASSVIYDMMKAVLSTEDGQRKYGMRFLTGKKDIPDNKIEDFRRGFSELMGRRNRGMPVNLEKWVEGFEQP
jgi:hypothetical protein